jgi:hypothetical protein
VFHRKIDVRMVVWRSTPMQFEFAHTDTNLAYRKLIVELRSAAIDCLSRSFRKDKAGANLYQTLC